MSGDLFSSLKIYLNQLADGEKSPADLLQSLNLWLRETTEVIKERVEEEVEAQVKKMGFVKKEEFDRLAAKVRELEKAVDSREPAKKSARIKKAVTSAAKRKASK